MTKTLIIRVRNSAYAVADFGNAVASLCACDPPELQT